MVGSGSGKPEISLAGNKSHATKTAKGGGGFESMAHFAAQLQFESDERKDAIMNESIAAIFNQLPAAMLQLDALLNDIAKLAADKYNEVKVAGWADDPKYKFMAECGRKPFPPPKPSQDGKTSSEYPETVANARDLLKRTCARHLMVHKDNKDAAKKAHVCSNSYTFPNTVNLYPWGSVPSNEELNVLIERLRVIFIELSQQCVNIQLGLSLMFPRSEDNEESNLSLDVLNKLIDLATVEYPDIFESHPQKRAELIQMVATYPHFGESHRMLVEYDRNACRDLQLEVQLLITQCARLYDALIKNFDAVLKVKDKCTDQSSGSGSEQSTPVSSKPEEYSGIYS